MNDKELPPVLHPASCIPYPVLELPPVLHPASRIPHPALKRVRWRCRRGLLELDIVLGRFIEQGYLSLDEAQQAAFDALLDMPDNELWDMIAGRVQLPLSGAERIVLKQLQLA